MRKLALAGALTALAVLPVAGASASEPSVTVFDPTPNQALSGNYTTGDPAHPTGYQQGYIYADQTGMEACNGNPETLPGKGAPGYLWVGQSHQPDAFVLVGVPGGYAGAGTNNKTDAQGGDYGAPCPQHHTNP